MFGRRLLAARRIVFGMVVSLLASQSALANYLCPAVSPPHEMATMAAGLPCDGSDDAQPALCHQHAADPGQVIQPAQVVPPSLPGLVEILVIPAAAPMSAGVAMPRGSAPEARPPPDPIFLATLRLRV